MIDPVSIVGLTIGIFDQLLKLGERSAELTSDIRAFSDVSPYWCRQQPRGPTTESLT